MRIPVSLLCFFLQACWLFGQSDSLPGCEPRGEVRQILEKLDRNELLKLKFTEQYARVREVLLDLIAKYPREVQPHRELLQSTTWWDRDAAPALRERYRKQAEQHPDDPLALYLAGAALMERDTPASVKLLEEARAKAPQFPWPAEALAYLHASGKLANKEKAAEEIAAFFNACPSSADLEAQWVLSKAGSADLQSKVAAALRARLAKETSPRRLRDYETLWGLEFRTRPPQQHAALRKQVAEDVQRLESLNAKPDANWLNFLKDAYKQSGATPEVIKTAEDRLLREFPTSAEAFRVLHARWRKEHKEPEDHKDAAAWAKYTEAYTAELRKWRGRFAPNLTAVQWFFAIVDDDAIPEAEGTSAMEAFLVTVTEYNPPASGDYMQAAGFLLDHQWQAPRALALLKTAEALLAKEMAERRQNDNLSAEDIEDMEESRIYEEQYLAGLFLRAAKLVGKPEEVQPVRAFIEGPPPKDKKQESEYWFNRARLAALDGHKTDALAFYQLALHTRVEPARYRRGKLKDDLTDEAHALWKDTGGSESAWALWSKPPAAQAQELAEGRWEKAKKQLPAFELADLSGKTWRLKSLEGKSVLINVWATWCGPCQSEQPKLQKLYEQVKNRSDIQILSFNIDADAGLVEPFMKEKGYTFPAVLAFNFVNSLLDSIAIPQNWIVDPKGTWRWTQLGFDSADSDWSHSMLERLESVKAN